MHNTHMHSHVINETYTEGRDPWTQTGPRPENLTSLTQAKYYQKGPGYFQISDRDLKIEHHGLFSTDPSQDQTDHGSEALRAPHYRL